MELLPFDWTDSGGGGPWGSNERHIQTGQHLLHRLVQRADEQVATAEKNGYAEPKGNQSGAPV